MHANAHKVDVSKWKESGETVYGGAQFSAFSAPRLMATAGGVQTELR